MEINQFSCGLHVRHSIRSSIASRTIDQIYKIVSEVSWMMMSFWVWQRGKQYNGLSQSLALRIYTSLKRNLLHFIWLNRIVIDLAVVVRFIPFVCSIGSLVVRVATRTNRERSQIITRAHIDGDVSDGKTITPYVVRDGYLWKLEVVVLCLIEMTFDSAL